MFLLEGKWYRVCGPVLFLLLRPPRPVAAGRRRRRLRRRRERHTRLRILATGDAERSRPIGDRTRALRQPSAIFVSDVSGIGNAVMPVNWDPARSSTI